MTEFCPKHLRETHSRTTYYKLGQKRIMETGVNVPRFRIHFTCICDESYNEENMPTLWDVR